MFAQLKIFTKKFILYTFLFIFCFLGFPSTAHAYIDPGSGNALIYLVVSLLGAFIYFVKNIIYKILGKIRGEKHVSVKLSTEHAKIIIFSEGKQYWYTFKPIIEAFIERQTPFSYITIDVDDPALTVDNPYMASKYIGSGSLAFAKIMMKSAKLMLSTTPNIGTPNFPLPRPKNVQCLAHIFHGVGDIGVYHKGSLDYYDAVLMVGDYMEESIRTIEKIRDLPAKECISLGLPYLDVLAEKIEKKTEQGKPATILIAPSWGDKSFLNICGTKILHDIAKAQYNIIIRPHPHSLRVEQEFFNNLQEEFLIYDNVRFDNSIDSTVSLQKADLLISDKSGIRFDFALLYERPVITIDAPFKNVEQYEYAELGKTWTDSVTHELGAVILPNAELDIMPSIEQSLAMPTTELATFRTKYITNFGTSGQAIAQWAEDKIKE